MDNLWAVMMDVFVYGHKGYPTSLSNIYPTLSAKGGSNGR